MNTATRTFPFTEITNHKADMQQCIENCLSCHAICLEMVSHCLKQGGPHAEANHIRMLLDCAEICQTSANFMINGSPFHSDTCGLCAKICTECAEECSRPEFAGDKHMQTCVEMCRRCAATCQEMAGVAT